MAYCYDSLYESNDDLELSFKTDSGREYRTVLSSFERIPFGESFARTIPAGCNTECCRNPRIPWSDVREHLHKLNVGIGTQTYRRRSVVH